MRLNVLKNLLVFAGLTFLLTSCDPDIIDPPGVSDPSVSVSGTPSGEIPAGSTFTITVTGTPTADNALKSVAFKEVNTNIPFGRLTLDGTAASANPILLFGADKTGFTWTVDIVAHDDASIKQYEVEITDDGNNVSQFTFDVTTAINLVEPTLTVAGNMTAMVEAGTLFSVKATLGMGTFDLASMSFFQGTVAMDASRVSFEGTTIDANPYNLPDGFKDGGEATILMRVQETAGTEGYRFVLTDADGNSVDYSFDITTGTPPDSLAGVLLNAAGPAGTGGLDLDTGLSTGSSDAAAEIKDLGIDTDLADNLNWIQKISGANDATVKALKVGENNLLEGFTFEGVNSREAIAALYNDNGIDLADGKSEVVLAGDVFVVNRGDKYYLINITLVTITASGNADSYTMDIKK